MTDWKNCKHGWRRDCYQCTPAFLALQAEAMKKYSEVLLYDKDALTIAKTFTEPHRTYFLKDDQEIECLKRLYPSTTGS